MLKGSVDKRVRNGRYMQMRRWGCSREQAKRAMDFSDKRYFDCLTRLTRGQSFDDAQDS